MWDLPAEATRVHAALAALQDYPQWWPEVRSVAELDPEVAVVRIRSFLPYTLELQMMREVEDVSVGVLRAGIDGDLHGWAQWQLTPGGLGTLADYTQEVSVAGQLAAVAMPAGPALRANYAWTMLSGQSGLRRLLS